jgi:hypothetical protein
MAPLHLLTLDHFFTNYYPGLYLGSGIDCSAFHVAIRSFDDGWRASGQRLDVHRVVRAVDADVMGPDDALHVVMMIAALDAESGDLQVRDPRIYAELDTDVTAFKHPGAGRAGDFVRVPGHDVLQGPRRRRQGRQGRPVGFSGHGHRYGRPLTK